MLSFTVLYTGVIVPASVSIPIGMGVYRYKYTSPPLRTILFYLAVAGITNAIAAFYAFRHRNNLPLLHIYTIAELLLLVRFYQQTMTSQAIRQWARLTLLLFPVVCIVNFIFFQSIYSFNSYTRPLESIILLIFSILYLSQATDNERASGRGIAPETWIVIGILLYFASTLFQFIFANIVSHHASYGTKLLIWDIHASLVLIMYLLFAVGFFRCKN